MGRNTSLGESTGYTMSNEFSANGMLKVVYGREYKTYSKFDDAPGQINIFETKEEFFDWTGDLANSCQAIAVDIGKCALSLEAVIVTGLTVLVSKAKKDEFSGSAKDMFSQFLGAVVDDRTLTGKSLGSLGKYYDQLMAELNSFEDIINEHVDVRPWLSAGEGLRKNIMGDAMAKVAAYIEDNHDKTDLAKLLEWGLDVGGFNYVDYDDGRPAVFESTIDAMIQGSAGFSDWVDSIGSIAGMDIDEQIVTFQEGGYEYRVELWKGSYALGGTTGAEIGLYRRPLSEAKDKPYVSGEKNYNIHYEVVPEDKYCEMSYTLYDHEEEQVVFTRDTKDDSQEGDKGWWPLTMRAGYVSEKEDLEMQQVKIEFWNSKAVEGFRKDLKMNYDIDAIIDGNTVKFNWWNE